MREINFPTGIKLYQTVFKMITIEISKMGVYHLAMDSNKIPIGCLVIEDLHRTTYSFMCYIPAGRERS